MFSSLLSVPMPGVERTDRVCVCVRVHVRACFRDRYVEVLSVCISPPRTENIYLPFVSFPLCVCVVFVCFAEVLRDLLWTLLSSYSRKENSCFLKTFLVS